MSTNVWKPRKEYWFKGYVIVPYELLHEYYDWEVDPMCDCTPAQKFCESKHEWMLKAYKTYAYRDGTRYGVGACREVGAEANDLSEEVKCEIIKALSDAYVPFRNVKDMFRNAELKAEAIRLMP